jgi:hypothetical protein
MAHLRSIVMLASAALVLTGCNRQKQPQPQPQPVPQPAMKPAPPTPIDEKREELGGKTWHPDWDVIVEKSLPNDMLSDRAARAVRSYCPTFAEEPEADKRAFWAYVFEALASAEAGLNPKVDVHHTQRILDKTDKVTKRPIRQEGLLQLTYEDDDRYGCNFDWAHDRTLPVEDSNRTILEPANNLECGIKIMQDQIITQHKPLVSRTSYWSTLQPGTVSYRVFAKQMANEPAACRLRPPREVRRRVRRPVRSTR